VVLSRDFSGVVHGAEKCRFGKSFSVTAWYLGSQLPSVAALLAPLPPINTISPEVITPVKLRIRLEIEGPFTVALERDAVADSALDTREIKDVYASTFDPSRNLGKSLYVGG